ncbi:MAG: metallophosphoesterase [Candidatus Thermoplasmatota archaeon]|nr:metallophosphoesterase [Candidatus Thermoplasmatota archaeon]
MKKLKIVTSFLIFLTISGTVVASSIQNQIYEPVISINNNQVTSDFYFVHITDTHVVNKLYDHQETRKHWLISLLEYIASFNKPPAFVVITGDLVEWGEGFLGALNYYALINCFYKNNTQFYADKNCSIPVYFTPGNHDHYPNRKLYNYHLFIDRTHINDNNRYVITHENLSLFFMNSGPVYYAKPSDWADSLGFGLTKDDIIWLEEKLSNCTTNHRIILMHHPAINIRNNNGELYDVFIHNGENFIELCKNYNVEIVLAGHTHEPRVFDTEEHLYETLPINSSNYPTLFVQSDDCKEGVHYRNISIVDNHIWIEQSQEINFNSFNNSRYESNSETRVTYNELV